MPCTVVGMEVEAGASQLSWPRHSTEGRAGKNAFTNKDPGPF